MAVNLSNIGGTYEVKGDLNKALEYYKKALEIDKEIEYKRGIAIDLKNIATVYKAMGKIEEAEDYKQRAERIYKVMEKSKTPL